MLILFQYYFRDVHFSKYALQVLWLWYCKSTLIPTSTVNFTWNVIIKHFHESWTLDQCNSCAFNPKFMYYQQRKLIFMAINTVHGCYIRWLFCMLLIWMQHLTDNHHVKLRHDINVYSCYLMFIFMNIT